jgi:hypothetical protein
VYDVQFRGSFCSFNCTAVWKAKVEGKHRFFAWLLLQKKLLVADKLLIRNWPCNPVCQLCDLVQETAEHISMHCSFAHQVWALVNWWNFGMVPIPSQEDTGALVELYTGTYAARIQALTCSNSDLHLLEFMEGEEYAYF